MVVNSAYAGLNTVRLFLAAGEGGANESGHPDIEHGEGAAGVW